MNLFESLNKFGFTNLNNIEIYKAEEKKTSSKNGTEKKSVHELDFLFNKRYKCTCCGKEIVAKTIKSNRTHITKTDLDLRNQYNGIDPYKYEIIFCSHCGYASLSHSFTALTDKQIKLIKEKITSKFKCNQELLEKSVYDYKDAITIHELALLNIIVKNGKNSEKAFMSLKLSWLYRGAIEMMDEKKEKDRIKEYQERENLFLKIAHKGFMIAREKESFPVAGMNENTLDYLLAALGYEINEKDACMKLLGGILTNRNATRNIKNKALNLKEILIKERNDIKSRNDNKSRSDIKPRNDAKSRIDESPKNNMKSKK